MHRPASEPSRKPYVHGVKKKPADIIRSDMAKKKSCRLYKASMSGDAKYVAIMKTLPRALRLEQTIRTRGR